MIVDGDCFQAAIIRVDKLDRLWLMLLLLLLTAHVVSIVIGIPNVVQADDVIDIAG